MCDVMMDADMMDNDDDGMIINPFFFIGTTLVNFFVFFSSYHQSAWDDNH